MFFSHKTSFIYFIIIIIFYTKQVSRMYFINHSLIHFLIFISHSIRFWPSKKHKKAEPYPWLPTHRRNHLNQVRPLRHTPRQLIHVTSVLCTSQTTPKSPRRINSTSAKSANADTTIGNSMYASDNGPERFSKCQQHTALCLTSFRGSKTQAVRMCCLHCSLCVFATKNSKRSGAVRNGGGRNARFI